MVAKQIIKRNAESKKGDNGEVLIIGGSEDYTGCLVLAGLAALRTGIDWISVAAPEKVAWSINAITPDLITKKIKTEHFSPQNIDEMLKISEKFDTILIGNGIGRSRATKQFIKTFIKKAQKSKKIKAKFVVDADAIKAISLDDIDNAVLTPHKLEFQMLLKNSNLTEKNFKQKLKNNIIVLKGRYDRIISAKRTKISKTGNPGMSVGGTGDILAGMLAGFLAQSFNPEDAAYYAAYINGLIADKLYKTYGYGFIASDFLHEIAKTIKQIGIIR